jgi:hypothetical protein
LKAKRLGGQAHLRGVEPRDVAGHADEGDGAAHAQLLMEVARAASSDILEFFRDGIEIRRHPEQLPFA